MNSLFDTGIKSYYYNTYPFYKKPKRQFPKFKREMFDSIREQELMEEWLKDIFDHESNAIPVISSTWSYPPQWRV